MQQPALDGDSSWECASITGGNCSPWLGRGTPLGAAGPLLGTLVLAPSTAGFGPAPTRIDLPLDVAEKALAAEEITLAIDLGRGSGSARIFSCDLTYDYVRINAEYTT